MSYGPYNFILPDLTGKLRCGGLFVYADKIPWHSSGARIGTHFE